MIVVVGFYWYIRSGSPPYLVLSYHRNEYKSLKGTSGTVESGNGKKYAAATDRAKRSMTMTTSPSAAEARFGKSSRLVLCCVRVIPPVIRVLGQILQAVRQGSERCMFYGNITVQVVLGDRNDPDSAP